MSHGDFPGDREPVFVRSGGPYVYNPRNPVGRVLIVLSLIVTGGTLYYLFAGSSWSDGELRSAVHEVPDALGAEPHTLPSIWSAAGHIEELIEEAVVDAGGTMAPSHGVTVEAVGEHGPYEVTARDTDTAFCLTVTQSVSEEGGFTVPDAGGGGTRVPEYDLTTTVAEGRC
ncbi:hypothetical protein CUT44_12375 [Streptomyces carminius]|uniref:Uncharacterized protein n=1 Tax=Streptomyces carminius TaxID=2665496 RepID=A0A2M8LZV5_9ACTN|nr:hypothetical protein [Streptomyces carminius]PJE97470.1 hypothetical protein CUT44_12375 [Streptomyces carminius]